VGTLLYFGSDSKHVEEENMAKSVKKSLILVVVASLLLIPFGSAALAQVYSEAEPPTGGAMIFDFCVVRPVGILATAVGAVFYVVSAPFAALGDNIDVAGQKLIKEPAAYTFKRPLGDFR
jgi:hypothetical protein